MNYFLTISRFFISGLVKYLRANISIEIFIFMPIDIIFFIKFCSFLFKLWSYKKSFKLVIPILRTYVKLKVILKINQILFLISKCIQNESIFINISSWRWNHFLFASISCVNMIKVWVYQFYFTINFKAKFFKIGRYFLKRSKFIWNIFLLCVLSKRML